MSWYRNAHYYIQSKWKNDFHELITTQLTDLQVDSPYSTLTKVFYKNPNCDPSNIVPLMEKVVLDTLQVCGALENDTVMHHKSGFWVVAAPDKLNPRCEITIQPFKNLEEL